MGGLAARHEGGCNYCWSLSFGSPHHKLFHHPAIFHAFHPKKGTRLGPRISHVKFYIDLDSAGTTFNSWDVGQ